MKHWEQTSELAARDCRKESMKNDARGVRFPSGMMRMFWNELTVIGLQLCDYIKSHLIRTLK